VIIKYSATLSAIILKIDPIFGDNVDKSLVACFLTHGL